MFNKGHKETPARQQCNPHQESEVLDPFFLAANLQQRGVH